jgi:hypothetical protein
MVGLVQPSPAAEAHRQHSSGRSRTASHGSVTQPRGETTRRSLMRGLRQRRRSASTGTVLNKGG